MFGGVQEGFGKIGCIPMFSKNFRLPSPRGLQYSLTSWPVCSTRTVEKVPEVLADAPLTTAWKLELGGPTASGSDYHWARSSAVSDLLRLSGVGNLDSASMLTTCSRDIDLIYVVSDASIFPWSKSTLKPNKLTTWLSL